MGSPVLQEEGLFIPPFSSLVALETQEKPTHWCLLSFSQCHLACLQVKAQGKIAAILFYAFLLFPSWLISLKTAANCTAVMLLHYSQQEGGEQHRAEWQKSFLVPQLMSAG